jgi:hypothetical protein
LSLGFSVGACLPFFRFLRIQVPRHAAYSCFLQRSVTVPYAGQVGK